MLAYDAAGNVSGFAPGIYAINPVPAPAALSNPTVLSSLAPAGSGGFQFSVQASAVQTTYVQATTNLLNPTFWVTIATNPPGSSFIFTDADTNVYPGVFLPGGEPVTGQETHITCGRGTICGFRSAEHCSARTKSCAGGAMLRAPFKPYHYLTCAGVDSMG